ncbi:MAG: hypothetical protein Q9174_001695 [Haloplaca sp. 1 TL-2023]
MSTPLGPTVDDTNISGIHSAQHILRRLPQTAVPFSKPKKIGQGTFGKVFKARTQDGHVENALNDEIAYKRICLPNGQIETSSEVNALRARQHDHILQVLDTFVQAAMSGVNYLYIVTPFARGGDMEAWMTSNETPNVPPNLNDQICGRHFLLESITSIVEAVAYCHAEIDGIWCGHYDIKPRNILLFQDNAGRWLWKLGDFGLSTIKEDRDVGTGGNVGTRQYQPPESDTESDSHLHGPSFDVFSTGCIVLQLATLLVFPWKHGMIKALKRELTQVSEGFAFRNPGATKRWFRRVVSEMNDGQAYSVLETALKMVSREAKSRLLAFDAALDLFEIASPNMDASTYEKLCERLIQGQGFSYRFSPDYKPVERALNTSRSEYRVFRMIRRKYLLRAGWTDTPTSRHFSEDGSFSNMPAKFSIQPFVGRAKELKEMRNRIATDNMVALYGIGGVGKSHLAWEYVQLAQKNKGEGPRLHTFWIQARNSSTIAESYASIAEAIGEVTDGQYSEDSVLRWFKRHDWILVLDGVNTSCDDWRNRCPFGHGPILITTRDHDLANYLCPTSDFALRIDPLGVQDNTELFFTMMSRPLREDRDYVRNLVMKLQLPILVKIMAKSIDSAGRVGSSVRTVEEKLQNRPKLAKRLQELEIRDPHADSLVPAVADIFDMLFETFKEESRVHGCKCLSQNAETSCNDCKRVINHSIAILRLLCLYSRTKIEKRLIDLEGVGKNCEDLTENAFVLLTSFCYIAKGSTTKDQYDVHDLVYTMFPAWYGKSMPEEEARKILWKGHLRALGMLQIDYQNERGKVHRDYHTTGRMSTAATLGPDSHELPGQSEVQIGMLLPLSLLKLRYKTHVEEFIEYVRNGDPPHRPFRGLAPAAITTFARLFNEEGRFEISQYLLRFLICRGVEGEPGRTSELHARIDHVSSMEQSTRGRNTTGRLKEILDDIIQTRAILDEVWTILEEKEDGNPERFLRLCIEKQVKVLLRLRRYTEAKRVFQELQRMEPRPVKEAKKLRLTSLKLQAECSRQQGRFENNFEELYISYELRQKLLDALQREEDLPYDAMDQAERVEDAEKSLADTKLILVEKARYRKSTPEGFDAGDFCASVYDFHVQYLEKKQSQYASQARENLDHLDIIDAEREFFIANLRIGLWEGDTDKVVDAVACLNDVLTKYEHKGLGIQHQGTRNSAYRRQEGLAFLVCQDMSHYEKDLRLLTERYALLAFEMQHSQTWSDGQSSTAAWREPIPPEPFCLHPGALLGRFWQVIYRTCLGLWIVILLLKARAA